jgi:uncharacterized protein
MSKPSIIVIHGGDSYRSEDEFQTALQSHPPRLKDGLVGWKTNILLELRDYFPCVLAPQMPRQDDAKLADWSLTFEKVLALPQVTNELIIIGHSLGACFLVQYLSRHNPSQRIQQLHLVAGCISEGDFNFQPDYAKIKAQTGQIHIWHSMDDKVVPFEQAKILSHGLENSTLHQYTDRGHFNQTYFPELIGVLNGNES